MVWASLTKKAIPSENYDLPAPMWAGGVSFHDSLWLSYSPFRVGGYAICQVNPNTEGEKRYSPIYVVPAEWEAFVAPAFAFCRANPALFSNAYIPMTLLRRTQLTALLNSPNPYLAAFACRTLTQTGMLDRKTIDRALLQADPFRQAMMTYLLLSNEPVWEATVVAEIEAGISAITRAAQTVNALNGITLGTGLALVTSGGLATQGARDDLAQARKRLAPDAPGDTYISIILHGYERSDK